MSNEDDIFWRRFGAILAGLVIFGFVVAFIARSIAGDAHQASQNVPAAVAKRIAPVGEARTGDPTKVVAAVPSASSAPAAAPTMAAADIDGEALYNTTCVACHATGAAGAPKKGDDAAWASRISLGEDALVKSVITGKGAMPPKAGNPGLTEEQIRAAVQFLLGTGGTASAAGAVETVQKAVSEVAEKATDMATEAAGDATDMAKKAAGDAAEMAKKAASDAGDTAASAVTAVTSAASSAAAPTAAADGKPGADVYNMGCVTCHATGIANAPKTSDKAAWETRLAVGGFDGLLKTAIAGKGAMPPKGGLPLADADLANAIHHMLKEAGLE